MEIDKKIEPNEPNSSETTQSQRLNVRPGDIVKIHQIIREKIKKTKGKSGEIKERIQVFEGIVLARKHGDEIGATITVRKIVSGIGVERIFPIHSPKIQKIEVMKRSKVRRAKLYYLRTAKGKRARLKKVEIKPIYSAKVAEKLIPVALKTNTEEPSTE